MANGQRLSEDRVNLYIDLNPTQAEQKYHELSKETREFKDRQKELNKELQQAQQHPRKNAEQIKKLKEEIKQCSSSIKDNAEKLKQCERQMGLSNLTMAQLKRHAGDLQKQLDRTSKNLHQDEWERYNRELSETRQRMAELKAASYDISPESMAIEAATIGNLIANTIGRVSGKLKELALEGVEMAESADGIQRAFAKLDNQDLLKNLRIATKGTVNDLQLMTVAVKAKDFRIPLEDLGKYLAYAQLKAQETGQSVEYLTDSIIMGLGRQSKQILDNLGLSATEINEEVEKTGDFVAGVTAIVDRQLADAGEAYESAADKATQATVRIQNAQLELGNALLPLKQTFDSVRVAGMNLLTFYVKFRSVTIPATLALTAFTAQLLKNRIATMSAGVAQKALSAIVSTNTMVISLAKAAWFGLTGQEKAATAALVAFKVACKSNPLGIVLTLLATAASAAMAFANRINETTESLTAMDRVNRRIAESDDTSIQRIQHLNKVIHDETAAIDLRREALAEARKIVPGYHAELTQEGKLINDNVNAITSNTHTFEPKTSWLSPSYHNRLG